jgi:hypothetical protein
MLVRTGNEKVRSVATSCNEREPDSSGPFFINPWNSQVHNKQNATERNDNGKHEHLSECENQNILQLRVQAGGIEHCLG